jgi:hypothetical protein
MVASRCGQLAAMQRKESVNLVGQFGKVAHKMDHSLMPGFTGFLYLY